MSENGAAVSRSVLGLRERALLLIGGAVVVVTALAYFVLSPWVAQSFDTQVSDRGEVMVGLLEQHAELRNALLFNDAKEANDVAQRLLRGDKDLAYVVLLDGEGRALGQSARETEASGAVVKAATELHLSDLQRGRPAGSKANEAVTVRGNADGVHRFTRVVARTEGASVDEFAELAGATAGPAKPLGTVLLGLSATEARGRLQEQTFYTIGLTVLIVALAFIIFFSRIVTRLRQMSDFAAKAAVGDLSAPLQDDARDEIGLLASSLREMTGRTGDVVARLQDAAQALSLASTELLSSSTRQGEAATQQAASVAQTGATVAELRETFNQASDRAQRVIDLARKSEESTTGGKGSVEESVAAMEEIRDHVLTMSRTIQSLVERTTQIGTIIDAVNDLAEQSNVLALNAAIEAAKAGEHGRGFAVVAREVRSLAERSKDSTAQVRFILKDIEKATREAMGVIDDGTRKMQSGMDLAHKAGEAIVDLDKAINESSTAARQIAASTRQQAVGVDQIWQAMRDIDRAVNESASGIRQLESTSRNMKDLSEQMAELVSRYRVARVSR